MRSDCRARSDIDTGGVGADFAHRGRPRLGARAQSVGEFDRSISVELWNEFSFCLWGSSGRNSFGARGVEIDERLYVSEA